MRVKHSHTVCVCNKDTPSPFMGKKWKKMRLKPNHSRKQHNIDGEATDDMEIQEN